DVPHGQLIDLMPQICQRPLDATVAPAWVVLGHAHDELLHLIGDTRAAQLSPLRTPVELPRDELSIPAQEGVRRDQRGDLLQTLAAKWVGARRKTAAFCVGEPPSVATEVGFEDAVL